MKYTEIINSPQSRRERLDFTLLAIACVPCGVMGVATAILLMPVFATGLALAALTWSKG